MATVYKSQYLVYLLQGLISKKLVRLGGNFPFRDYYFQKGKDKDNIELILINTETFKNNI